MDRQRAKELFSDYLEDELEDAEKRELEAFLEQDPAAKAELEALKKTLSSLYGLRAKAPAPPPDLANKVERRIRRRSRGRFFAQGSGRLLWRVPFEWISFIIILLLLALYMTTVLEGRKKKAQPAPRAPAGKVDKSKAPAPSQPTPAKTKSQAP